MSRRVVLGIASVSTILSACYLTTSFEGLSSGGTDGGGADATTSTEAGSDGSSEASVDAGVDACAVSGMTTRLCDGFERTDPRGPWTGESTTGGGTIETIVDTTTSSRVFHARAPAVSNGLAQASLRHETKLTSKARFEADLRYTTKAFENGRQLVILDITGAGKVYVAMFILTDQGMAFYEQVDPGEPTVRTKIHVLKTPVPEGSWHRLSLDLDLDTNRVAVLVDGAPALPADEVYDYVREYAGTDLTVRIGPTFSSAPSSEIDAYFDNVVIASD